MLFRWLVEKSNVHQKSLVYNIGLNIRTSEDLYSNSHNLGAIGLVYSDAPSKCPLIDVTESPLTQFVVDDNLTGV